MKDYTKLTKIFCLITFAVVIIYDIVIVIIQPTATISNVTLTLSYKIAFIPFALGFICGHIFWAGKKGKGIWGLFVGIAIGIILSIIQSKININPIIYVLIGIPCGHILWTQRKPKI